MPGRAPFLLTRVGAVAALVGLVGAVVLQLHPWQSCPYDDTPSACAMTPEGWNAFLAFVVVLLVGLIALITAWTIRLKALGG